MVKHKFNELLVEFGEKFCDNSLKLENEFFEADRVMDMQVEKIITTGDDSDDNDEASWEFPFPLLSIKICKVNINKLYIHKTSWLIIFFFAFY